MADSAGWVDSHGDGFPERYEIPSEPGLSLDDPRTSRHFVLSRGPHEWQHQERPHHVRPGAIRLLHGTLFPDSHIERVVGTGPGIHYAADGDQLSVLPKR